MLGAPSTQASVSTCPGQAVHLMSSAMAEGHLALQPMETAPQAKQNEEHRLPGYWSIRERNLG